MQQPCYMYAKIILDVAVATYIRVINYFTEVISFLYSNQLLAKFMPE